MEGKLFQSLANWAKQATGMSPRHNFAHGLMCCGVLRQQVTVYVPHLASADAMCRVDGLVALACTPNT
jgi:hypothetical protein